MNKKISIIIPCYNVSEYLPKCLDSVINQTYQELEIICVNDGSKDNTLDILNEYKSRDSRIVIINQENRGLSGARNSAMKIVSGEYIMFLDGDDWIDENTCEIALKSALEKDSDLVVFNYIREFENASKPRYILGEEKLFFENQDFKYKIHRRIVGLYEEELSAPEAGDSLVTACVKLYKTEKIINTEFVDTKKIGTEDALFNIYALINASSAVYIPDCLYHYRKTNATSLTSTYKKDLYSQWHTLYVLINEFLDSNNLDETYYTALENRIALSIIGLGLNVLSADKDFKKVKEIKRIISATEYRCAYKQLELKYLPMHWKLFFSFAKHNNAFGVYMMLKAIQFLIGR